MIRIFFLGMLFAVNGFAWAGEGGRIISGDGGFRSGQWRAFLERKDGQEIVFNFEVKDSARRKLLYIRNAGERMLVDDVTVKGDSVWITLPFFESQLRAAVTPEGGLRGVWLKRGANGYQSLPFRAEYGVGYRFPVGTSGGAAGQGKDGAAEGSSGKAAGVTGRWKAVFVSPDGKDTSVRVGEFVQAGARVTGTFLDPTGDFRYLEGVVDGDSLKLSCFDGAHAFLFTAKVENNNNAISGGLFYSGAAGFEHWTAVRDAGAQLPDEFSLTKWKKDAGPVQFTFRDTDGKNVSLGDKRFKGKVVILQIMGSWCPNCMDETQFLSPFYNEYRSKGVEIIGLAYERTTDFERSRQSLKSFQTRFGVKYPVLITGVTVGDPKRAEKTLPQLDAIVGFPTTIFLDRKGNIARIHTGFNGPGTGAHYEEQKKEIYQIVDRLLAE